MVKYFTNSIFLSVIVSVIILYSGILSKDITNSHYSLIPESEVNRVVGKIISSPLKSSTQKYYSCDFLLQKTYSSKNMESSSDKKIKIYIPATSVEAFFPGKLYSQSKSKDNYIFENGGIYDFEGSFSNGMFYAKKCNLCTWKSDYTGKIQHFRALARLQFKRLMYSWGNAGGLLLALLSGAKEYTEQTVSTGFRLAGLSHILALSGMHLSMFAGIAMFIGKKSGRKKLSNIIRIVALILFVWFAGFSPSLLRAFICSMLLIVAGISNVKQPDMILILSFSFIFQAIISPSDVYNVGFLLSYGALFGILIFNNYFKKIYIKFLPQYFSSSLSSSTSAQIFTAPISLKIFGSFSPIGIISTTVISPLITLFIYIGLAFIILSLIFPFISDASGIFMNFLYTIIKSLVLTFSKVPVWSVN